MSLEYTAKPGEVILTFIGDSPTKTNILSSQHSATDISGRVRPQMRTPFKHSEYNMESERIINLLVMAEFTMEILFDSDRRRLLLSVESNPISGKASILNSC